MELEYLKKRIYNITYSGTFFLTYSWHELQTASNVPIWMWERDGEKVNMKIQKAKVEEAFIAAVKLFLHTVELSNSLTYMSKKPQQYY